MREFGTTTNSAEQEDKLWTKGFMVWILLRQFYVLSSYTVDLSFACMWGAMNTIPLKEKVHYN